MRVPFIIPDGGGFVKLDAGWIFRYHGPDDEVMTMQYLCAPMEGVTGDLFRQAQRQTFPAVDSYYTPFLSPTANRTFSPRELREIEPAHNAGIRVVPQLMGHCAEDFLWMAGQLADMGYDEVNFNLGCPSNTVTVKKKGAGLLTEPDLLRRFFDAVFAACPLPVSVKTRLGKTTAETFPALLELYNDYPICELIVHPRVQADQYHGHPDLDMFAYALAHSHAPVCYNGDVTTAAQLHALEEEFPALSGIMVGRGLIADPALFRKARGGASATKEELRGYLTDLYHGYTELFGSAGCAISRMKGHWFYLIHCFAGAEKLEKQLKKLREPWEYEVVVNQIFTLPLVEND